MVFYVLRGYYLVGCFVTAQSGTEVGFSWLWSIKRPGVWNTTLGVHFTQDQIKTSSLTLLTHSSDSLLPRRTSVVNKQELGVVLSLHDENSGLHKLCLALYFCNKLELMKRTYYYRCKEMRFMFQSYSTILLHWHPGWHKSRSIEIQFFHLW